MLRKWLLVSLLFCLVVCVHGTIVPTAFAGLDDAKAAYNRGDYTHAAEEFKALWF